MRKNNNAVNIKVREDGEEELLPELEQVFPHSSCGSDHNEAGIPGSPHGEDHARAGGLFLKELQPVEMSQSWSRFILEDCSP